MQPDNPGRGAAVIYISLALVCLTVWWAWIHEVDLVWAMKGFGPVGWVYKIPSRSFPWFSSGASCTSHP